MLRGFGKENRNYFAEDMNMRKYFLPISILILSISIFYGGFQLSSVMKSQESDKSSGDSMMDKGLLTLEEAALFLSMSTDELNIVINRQEFERKKLSSFETYRFIPFITMNNKRYFNKDQLNKWIEYNSIIWSEISDN